MEKLWKIKNITAEQVKISVCVKSNMSPGIILQPNQYCIARQQMTSPLDKQSKCKKVMIEAYENVESLPLAVAFDEK